MRRIKGDPGQIPGGHQGGGAYSDTHSPTETDIVLSDRFDENHSNAVPEMPTR